MPLKNYTTKVAATKSIAEISAALVDCGATGIAIKYERVDCEPFARSLQFEIEIHEEESVIFDLPVNWQNFKRVLAEDYRIKRAVPDTRDARAYAHRVAWRVARDWVLAQAAFIETEMVEVFDVFLPYAVTGTGETVADRLVRGPDGARLLLSAGGTT